MTIYTDDVMFYVSYDSEHSLEIIGGANENIGVPQTAVWEIYIWHFDMLHDFVERSLQLTDSEAKKAML